MPAPIALRASQELPTVHRTLAITAATVLSLAPACSRDSDAQGGSPTGTDESTAQEESTETGLPSIDSLDTGDGDGDGDGDPSDGSDGDENPDNHSSNCGEVNIDLNPLPPNIMLVLDKSGSMATKYWDDGQDTVTRWHSLHGIVSELLDEFRGKVQFGLEFYPRLDSTNEPAGGCKVDAGVEVENGIDTAREIIAAIPEADAIFAGMTPTNTGLSHAVDFLKDLDDTNNEAILLVLDGETNCGQSNEDVRNTAAEALEAGIPVYVVGVDLEEYVLEGLEQVAQAGGTKKVYNTQDATALEVALESLIMDIGTCKVPLDPVPKFEEFVEVEVGGTVVPWLAKHTDCNSANADGWVFTSDQAPWTEIELCGRHCDEFLAAGQVDITFECPPPE